jgi:hypothetical protein
MKAPLALDLAAHQTLKELSREAEEILAEVNLIVIASDPKETPECVQWKSSRVLSVAFVLADTSRGTSTVRQWSVVLSKPSGPFGVMAGYIYKRLSERRGTDVYLSCFE